MENKIKTHCKRGHELTQDNITIGSDGYTRCNVCHRISTKIYAEKNKEKVNARSRQWTLDHPERVREICRKADHKRQPQKTKYMKKYYKIYIPKLKREVLTHYGNGKLQCLCCSENLIELLTIDHIKGRTHEDEKRPELRAWMLLQYLKSNNFPEGYQTLCWNCNSGRQLNNGTCPHKSIPNTIKITENWVSN